jgi:hypothetical protein
MYWCIFHSLKVWFNFWNAFYSETARGPPRTTWRTAANHRWSTNDSLRNTGVVSGREMLAAHGWYSIFNIAVWIAVSVPRMWNQGSLFSRILSFSYQNMNSVSSSDKLSFHQLSNSVVQEPEGSSPHSQQPATGPYHEPVESNAPPPPQANLPKIHSDSILPPTPWFSELSLCFGLPTKTLYKFRDSRQTCHRRFGTLSQFLFLFYISIQRDVM